MSSAPITEINVIDSLIVSVDNPVLSIATLKKIAVSFPITPPDGETVIHDRLFLIANDNGSGLVFEMVKKSDES